MTLADDVVYPGLLVYFQGIKFATSRNIFCKCFKDHRQVSDPTSRSIRVIHSCHFGPFSAHSHFHFQSHFLPKVM
jgi:hypothetical protein